MEQILPSIQGMHDLELLLTHSSRLFFNTPSPTSLIKISQNFLSNASSSLSLPDGLHPSPTGHGSRVRDQDGDEEDGYDETLVPVDFQRSGQIRDDDIFKMLVKPLRAGGKSVAGKTRLRRKSANQSDNGK